MASLHILYLEDNPNDVFLIEQFLQQHQLNPELTHVTSEKEFAAAMDKQRPDIILSDHALPGYSYDRALALAKTKYSDVPFILFSDLPDLGTLSGHLQNDIYAVASKNHPEDLLVIIQNLQSPPPPTAVPHNQYHQAMQRLVDAVQELSLARDLETIMSIVRLVARELTGADGATFVLRDGDQCYYAEENAISPLWRGMRFSMSMCISGWVMLNKQHANIEDIYVDPRIPADAYKPTFVKSLVMVPVRTEAPIAAIGNYWATPHKATTQEIDLLQALANTTSVAMENVQVYAELEARIKARTRQLEDANKELDAFSSSVSHDLRAPLRAINGYSGILIREFQDTLNEQARIYLQRIHSESKRMAVMIDDLLELSKYSRSTLNTAPTNLGHIVNNILSRLQNQDSERDANFIISDKEESHVDSSLIQIALENLLSNAWKYTGKKDKAIIEFYAQAKSEHWIEYTVKDNGAGFDMQYATKLFEPFQRLHSQEAFEGTGVGLATVQRIIRRHGGDIRAKAMPNQGATFIFTLPRHGKTSKALLVK